VNLKEPAEIKLIRRLGERIKNTKSVLTSIGDDCAVLKWTKEKSILFASDMLVEDVHFKLKEVTPKGRPVASPQQIGSKSLAVNISDVAAMGGIPKYAVVSLGLPVGLTPEFINGFYKGLLRLAKKFSVDIVGGDITRSANVVVDVAVIGEVKKENLTLRSTARPNDIICVTGTLGGSRFGRHLNFVPKLKEAQILVNKYRINSMMDLSDGLGMDLNRLAEMSKCGALIYESSIPVANKATLKNALYEGEDFELLFTLSSRQARRLFRKPPRGLSVTQIGRMKQPQFGVKLEDSKGIKKTLEPKGFSHF